jgi:hypothetical protein
MKAKLVAYDSSVQKYYGTYVDISTETGSGIVEIWIPHGPPSEREGEDYDGSHYESVYSLKLADMLVKAVNGE